MVDTDFWNVHSLRFLEMAFKTHHRERIENPDGYGTRTGDCGDRVDFFIMVKDSRLKHICFDLDGCVNTMACCNTVVHLAGGRSLEGAWEISPDQVAAYLQTLPGDHYHCAELCVGAFYLALADFKSRQAGPGV